MSYAELGLTRNIWHYRNMISIFHWLIDRFCSRSIVFLQFIYIAGVTVSANVQMLKGHHGNTHNTLIMFKPRRRDHQLQNAVNDNDNDNN